MENNSVGKNLIYHRKRKGYSQEDLSAQTEITVRTIQRIEKGAVNPHLQTVKMLAVALDIEVDELLNLQNPKEEAIQKKWLLLLHGTPLLGFILPFCNVLFPLFLWIHKRDDNVLYDRHGSKIINFHITVLILYALAFVALLTIENWGFIIFISVIPLFVLIVLANIVYAVKEHKCYYPLAIPFLKFKEDRMTKTLLYLFAVVALSNCTSQDTTRIVRLDESKISADSLKQKIQKAMVDADIPGMAVTIFNDNSPVFEQVFGYRDNLNKLPLTDSTNIYGASLSKAVFSVLVMDLVEDGVIDLDTPLESYLPKKIYEYEPQTRWHDDYSSLKKDSLYHKITARMCLAHTSGFPNWRTPQIELQTFHEPGKKHRYSGEGFVYLQVVLEKLTGKGLNELAIQRIFSPLGMSRSAFFWKPEYKENVAFGHDDRGNPYEKDIDNEPRGASTLETTAADYTKFLQGVLEQKIITKKSYNEIFSLQAKVTEPSSTYKGIVNRRIPFRDTDAGYGLGWGYLDTPYGIAVFKGGNGSGFQHYSVLFPEKKMGMMIMTNSNNGRSIFIELLRLCLKDHFSTMEVAVIQKAPPGLV
ncbi:serine hydrolase [Flagellimonas sp.]|uniref:serine hydrolase n=1 Tax=Flagellimonas sp. TaxID=2058762 RepID=UPI003F4A3031